MHTKTIVAAAGLLALISTQSHAVTFEFSGAFGSADPFFANETFSGSFSYDDTAANLGTSTQASYTAITGFNFALSGGDSGSFKPTSAPGFSVQVDDFNPGDAFPDRWAAAALATDLNTTLSNLFFVGVILTDPTQTAQNGIPASGVPLPNLPLLTDRQFLVQFDDGFTFGTIESVSQVSEVPLPPALLLFLTGLTGLGGIATNRRGALKPA
jgi:hypothetical protein